MPKLSLPLSAAFCFFNALLLSLLIMTSPDAESQLLTFKNILDRPELKTTHYDHKIAYGSDLNQYGELWLPSASTSKEKLPVVVLIHGGCWLADLPGPELVAFLSDDLRKHGVAVWSLTYRRVGHKGGGYPGTFQDIANGVAHLRELEVKYNLDLSRVVVTGHSAGGHLALWSAAQSRIPADSPLKNGQKVKFKAVIGIAAIPDLAYFARAGAHACGDKTVDQLVDAVKRAPMTFTTSVQRPFPDMIAPFRDTSPSEMLPLGVKQILMQGSVDPIVRPENGLGYSRKALGTRDHIEVITLEKSGHFELIAPWTLPGQAVVRKILEALK